MLKEFANSFPNAEQIIDNNKDLSLSALMTESVYGLSLSVTRRNNDLGRDQMSLHFN